MRALSSILIIFLLSFVTCFAQKKKADKNKAALITSLDAHYDTYKQTALQIWQYAEVGYKEEKSSALLEQLLEKEGFTVARGVAGIPTAFVATYGSGSPVLGILAEYDALPGLSQKAVPVKEPAEGRTAGHGCGHHLFGTASVAAALAVKDLLAEGKIKGTLKVYGCPAEEGGSGKVYMVRAGLFEGMDAVIHWHPGDANGVSMTSAIANKSAKFRFYGQAAHASMAPEKGRSALDGVEAMNYMVNMMREHVPQESRIHYVITSGGSAPNVVPDYAEVYYYVRHPRKDEVKKLFDKLVKAAEGAALGTATKMEYEVIGGTHDLLLNRTLAEVMQANFDIVGGVHYSAEEISFAEKLQSTFEYKAPPITAAEAVLPLKKEMDAGGGSTDVGDVSYVVPTVGLRAATWVPGTAAHSWQAVACGGTDIGVKGLMVAAKTMAMTAFDLFSNPTLLKNAHEEFKNARGDYHYEALLGDRKPALNYRD